jgi:hypothetical protein
MVYIKTINSLPPYLRAPLTSDNVTIPENKSSTLIKMASTDRTDGSSTTIHEMEISINAMKLSNVAKAKANQEYENSSLV